ERDAVAVDVRPSQQLSQRALRLSDAVEGHASRSVNEKDEERARLTLESLEAKLVRVERARRVVRSCETWRGGPERRVNGDAARAALGLKGRARVTSARGEGRAARARSHARCVRVFA